MKKIIWILLPLVLLANFFFTPIKAEETVTVYVNAAGKDTNDGLTEENALLTLAKAAELVNADVDGKNFIIYVTSDLTMQESARFYNHNVTIVGKGENVPVVTRGDDFKSLSDTARSWYNPAMVEIQTSASEASLTLKNIVFDDNFKHEGSIFAQAISGEGKEDNTVYVQDAIVASNATKKCTITLDEGAILRNFGGMSAVRVTNTAEVVMKNGSLIEDGVEYVRKKSGTNNKDEVGAAGAVWLQGGKFVMEEGAEIRNINGRAIYADGGHVELAGTISDITSNKANMWFGDAGIVLHLRNKATALLKSTSVMDNHETDTVKGSAAVAVNGDCRLVADYGAVIRNYNMTAIAVSGAATVNFDGEITNITNGGNAMNIQRDGFNITLGKNSNIHHNVSWYGTVYIQGDGTVNLYGKINDNFGTDRAGGIAMAHNLNASHVNMYDGAEICRNYSPQTGGGLMVSKGTFHMYGGTIADNVAKDVGGGIYVRNGGMVIIDGGTIENNISKNAGGGIMFEGTPWGNPAVQPYVEINDGKIVNNYMFAAVQDKLADKVYEYSVDKTDAKSNDVSISQKGSFGYIERCVRINNSDVLSNKDVYFVVDNKTVTAVNNSEQAVWLGNANTKTVIQLKAASDAKGWGNQIASFYVYRCDESIELKVGGLNFNENLPVFAVVLKGVDANGDNEQDAEVEFYNTVVDGKDIYVTLPGTGDEKSLGRDVILVQPTDNIGSVVIEGPKELLYNKALTAYKVPYTATYVMPKGFMEVIKQVQDKVTDVNCRFTFVVELDPRLTAEFVDFTSPIFVADVDNAKIEGSKVTVNCYLKDDWKEHIDELATTSMVLHGNGILKAEDFQIGDVLSTTGHIEVTAGIMSLYLPANVVNTLEVKRVGNLTITKVVEGAATGDNETFDFTVRLSDETITGTYGDLEFKNGEAHAVIHAGETLTAEELPVGVSYTVTEDSTSYEYVTTYENAEGTIEEEQTSEVKIINTYNVGSLLITKTVKGIKTTEKFKIMIKLSEEINGYYNDILFENGIGYIELADGEEYVIDNLPSGINYLIEEVDVDETKYKVTYKNDKGIVGIDETVKIDVINTYQTKIPDTGDHSGIYYWVAIMFVSAVAIGFAVYKKKKNY